MALPVGDVLGGIGLGMNILGGIFGSSAAKREAERRRRAMEQALADFKLAGDQEYQNAQQYGTAGLYGLSGALRTALANASAGRADTSALGGVYRSTADTGATENMQAANAAQLAAYAQNLAEKLASIRNQNAQAIANMRFGMESGAYNDAVARQDAFGSGLGNAFLLAAQMFGTPKTRAATPGTTPGAISAPTPKLGTMFNDPLGLLSSTQQNLALMNPNLSITRAMYGPMGGIYSGPQNALYGSWSSLGLGIR